MNDWHNRVRESLALLRSGQARRALQRLEGAQSADAPAQARFALAQAQLQLGMLESAIALLEPLASAGQLTDQALHQLAMAHNNLASRLIRAGDLAPADRHLARALQLRPGMPEALENRARIRYRQGDFDGCAELLGPLVRDGMDDEVAVLLARAHLGRGDPDAARAGAVRINDAGRRFSLLAEAALHDGDGAQAREQFAHASRAAPEDFAHAVKAALTLQPVYADGGERERERAAFEAGLTRLEEVTAGGALHVPRDLTGQPLPGSFYLAYQGMDDRALQERSGRLLESWLGADAHAGVATAPVPGRVLAVSGFLRDSTVGHYFRHWWEALRRDGYDVRLMQLGWSADALTTAMAGGDRDRVLARDAGLHELLSEIRGLRPEVIVFPEVGMHDLTRLIAAHRLAPLQIAAWGHPVTTGLESIDVFASSDTIEPPDADAHYSETLWRLPGLGTRYEPAQASDRRRRDFGLDKSRPVVLVPHNAFKIAPEMDAVVRAVLAGDPDIELVFVEGSAAWQARLLRRRLEAALGRKAMARVRWLPPMRRADFLALCRAGDACLDCWPFSGGNVSLDSLSVGTPVVTMRGDFMRGRQTAAMLDMLGLDRLVAEDEGALVQRLLEAVRSPELRDSIRAGLDSLFFQDAWRETLLTRLAEALGKTRGGA